MRAMLFLFLGCTDAPSPAAHDVGSLGTMPPLPDPVAADDSGAGSGSGPDDSGTDDSADTGPKPWLVPDFALVDLNPSSPTYGATISPRDYEGRVTGWYFIHAT
jgi:hypothetical protein